MIALHLRSALLLTLTGAASGFTSHAEPSRAAAEPEAIVVNDNRVAAGTLKAATLNLDLEIREGALHPEDDKGPSLPVLAFAEQGKPLRVPGPLIRVRQGTRLHVTIRNPFKDSTLTVHGLNSHTSSRETPLTIPGGETGDVTFSASVPGTFFYWATTGNRDIDDRQWFESSLGGAFIVDAPNAPTNDRIFVINTWFRDGDSTLAKPREPQDMMTINGKSWPYTERLTFTQGDTVRWRWINPSVDSHPMHMHGFYYRMESEGDMQVDHQLKGDEQHAVVTHLMLQGTTMKLRWVPDRTGNWIFHCHFSFHTSHFMMMPRDSAHEDHAMGDTPVHGMAGLVMGLSVLPNPAYHRTSATDTTVHNIRLIAQQKQKRFGKFTGMGYVTQEGSAAPANDSVLIPGPVLILKRGQPARITVVNHLNEPTAVHWHGIELESFPDGVPGWSGSPGRIMPPIAPRDSFIAEFVPPRAGTFIYHTHDNDQLQMGSGLYGALIVVPPDKPYNPTVDKLFIVGGAGPADSMPNFSSPGYVNGSGSPPPTELKAGMSYRFRLININPDYRVLFSLFSPKGFAEWKPLAIDGADLPLSQQTPRNADYLTGPGMTADFEFTPPSPGNYRLEIKTVVAGWIIPVTIHVR
jgi:FtsP/CotA-like multicopper oxidase with cupredoxin domain